MDGFMDKFVLVSGFWPGSCMAVGAVWPFNDGEGKLGVTDVDEWTWEGEMPEGAVGGVG